MFLYDCDSLFHKNVQNLKFIDKNISILCIFVLTVMFFSDIILILLFEL